MKRMKEIMAVLLVFAMLISTSISWIPVQEVKASEEVLTEEEDLTGEEDSLNLEEDGENEEAPADSEESLQVAESGPNMENSEESILKVTGIALSQETRVQLNPLAVPGNFTVNVSIDNPENREINTIRLLYSLDSTGKTYEYTAFDPTASGNVCQVNVDVNKYATSGKYMLQKVEVSVVTNRTEGMLYTEAYSYTYNSEKSVFESNKSEYDAESGERIFSEFAYAGELDYTVVGTEGDEFIPYITSIKKVTTGDIYSATPVKFNIGYVEQGSGVKSIRAIFSMEGNASETDWFNFSAPSEKEFIGEGTITISSSKLYGKAAGDYSISSLEIEDNAGNRMYYSINEENGMLVGSRDGEEYKIVVQGCSYTVLPSEKYIELKSIKAATDKEHLTAGDTFSIIATIRNTASDSISIDPAECSAVWERADTEERKMELGRGVGEEVFISPGVEKEITFQVTPGQYSTAGKRNLSNLSFYLKSSDGFIGRSCSVQGGQITMWDSGSSLYTAAYNGEADYTVTVSSTPDEVAPYIEDISVLPKNVKAPGEVKLVIKVRDEGFAKAESIRYGFKDIKNPKNIFRVGKSEGNKELVYSEVDNAYICTIKLPATLIKGTYELQYIYLYDAADNSRNYNMKEGKLTDTEENVCPTCAIEIIESETDDDDFDAPVLTAFELLQGQEKLTAGSKIQLRMKVEDVSGISKIRLDYRKADASGMNMYTTILCLEGTSAVLEENGQYLYDLVVDKYCKTEKYQLSNVLIYDNSVRRNAISYSYDEAIGMLKDYSTNTYVAVSGNTEMEVTQMADIIIVNPSIENISAAITNIEKKGTVVVKESATGEQTLPKSFMQTVKEKELTVIVSDVRSNSELVIQGAALGAAQGDLELSVYRDEAVNGTVMVNNTRDNIYYPVTVVTSDTTIPVTIRIKLDDDFRKKCGDNPVRLSRETADGSMVLVQDKLKISEDGYIEAVFENGLSGGIASQLLYADGSRVQDEESGKETIEFFVSSRTEDSGDFILGDINGDGDIKMADLMMCLHHVSGRTLLSGTQFAAADINGDGQIAMADLMKLLHYVSGRNKELN